MSKDKSQEGGEPKIIVDEDWKSQAEVEKQKLADADESASTGGEAENGPRTLPPASFSVLVSSLVTQILFALGAIEDPQTKKRYLDLALAKHNIDMLSVLEEKTGGNLTEEEKKMLDSALYEVRMAYVQAAQAGGA
ncbi:MAG: DUF1844 domain-containing protein [Phycisphaerae bacterium]|nr:DUF1844 domain-containing protein [Phycisphaerae bacterium]